MYDISNPSQPSVGNYYSSGSVYHLEVDGDNIFDFADSTLTTYKNSNGTLTQLGSLNISSYMSSIYSLTYENGYAYIRGRDSGSNNVMMIADVTDPADIRVVDFRQIDVSDYFAGVSGRWLYLYGKTSGLQRIPLTD